MKTDWHYNNIVEFTAALVADLEKCNSEKLPPCGLYKNLIWWVRRAERIDEKTARDIYGLYTVGKWLRRLQSKEFLLRHTDPAKTLRIYQAYENTYCVSWYENDELINAVNGITDEKVFDYIGLFYTNKL